MKRKQVQKLIEAAARGDVDVVRHFIETGTDVNDEIRDEWEVLEAAARSSNPDVTKLLIESAARVDEVNKGGLALLTASYSGNAKVVSLILGLGVPVDATVNRDPRMAAVDAGKGNRGQRRCREEFSVALDMALAYGLEADPPGLYQVTPLMTATTAEVVHVLVNGGADLEARDVCGCTPLMRAALNANAEVMEALVDRGAKVHACCSGETVLSMACSTHHWWVYRERRGPLDAPLTRNPELVKALTLLVDLGADVSGVDAQGSTPMKHALRQGYLDAVRLLVKRGGRLHPRRKLDRKGFLNSCSRIEHKLSRIMNKAIKAGWFHCLVIRFLVAGRGNLARQEDYGFQVFSTLDRDRLAEVSTFLRTGR